MIPGLCRKSLLPRLVWQKHMWRPHPLYPLSPLCLPKVWQACMFLSEKEKDKERFAELTPGEWQDGHVTLRSSLSFNKQCHWTFRSQIQREWNQFKKKKNKQRCFELVWQRCGNQAPLKTLVHHLLLVRWNAKHNYKSCVMTFTPTVVVKNLL